MESTKVEETIVDYDLSKFVPKLILNNNTNRKSATIIGKFPHISETDQAIVILEKNAFTEKNFSEDGAESIFTANTELTTEFINNIYGNFQCFVDSKVNGLKATIIYPATEKHIEKYSIHEKYIVQETPALYENVTTPHLKSEMFGLEWVYNILEHKKEKDRIMFEDEDPETGFILLPDLKWDGKTAETLYALALPHKRNIKSLRDLDDSHLELLRNIRDKGCDAIEKKYGVGRSQLRIYFHYQPTFYHIHVHFNMLKNEAPGIYCEKSHLLDTVINNIELMPDYYKKATIPFVLYDGDRLFDRFDEELRVRKKVKHSEE